MRPLESISLAHLRRMTNQQGLLACAIHDVPDPYRGHRTRDNAEALRLLAMLTDHDDNEERHALATRYMAFLRGARRDDRTFHHHRDAIGHWTSPGDDDIVNAHVAWSLATALTSDLADGIKTEADRWLNDLYTHAHARDPMCHGSASRASDALSRTGGPDPSDLGTRLTPLALWTLALTTTPSRHPLHDECLISQYTERLVRQREATRRDTGWPWFTPEWTPGGARVVAALWHAADVLDDARLYRAARSATDFIIETLFEEGLFLPAGTRGWGPGRDKAIFDQRPIEAATVTELLATAECATADARYGQFAEYAFRWFHGNNIRGQQLASLDTGACCHAIRKHGTDTNQHAAATLAYLNAHTPIQKQHSLKTHSTLTIAMDKDLSRL